MLTELVAILQAKDALKGQKKALDLIQKAKSSGSLHLRSMELAGEDLVRIASSLQELNSSHPDLLTSVSLSYNPLQDTGVIALMEGFAPSIEEIGLVRCGIGDKGGWAVLNWMKSAPKLKLVCIEQNRFSEEVIKAFRTFQKANPQVMVVT